MMSVSRSRWLGIDSWAGEPLYSLAPTSIEEGMALCAIMEGGLGKSTVLASVSGTDKFTGIAYNNYTSPTQLVFVETITVPASPGPYTMVTTNTPIAGNNDMLVKDAAGQVYAFNAAHGANQYNIVGSTLTFDSSAAGAVVTLTYNYAPTVQQAQALFGDGLAGHTTPAAITGTIGLIRQGTVYTTNFDPLVDWSTNPAMKVIANGLIGTSGSGPTINGRVVEVPSADSPYLGIYFRAP